MSNLFYRNSRLLVLTICLILVAGASSYQLLPRMEDPQLTERAANVNTLFPGADAERVESLVTEKLEEELQEIEEIKEIRSNSRPGVSTITVELRDDVYEVDTVWSRIRDKIGDVTPELPQGALEPEFKQAEVKAYALILALTWQADGPVNYAILRRLAEQLQDKLEAVAGTEKVELFGDPDEEFRVEVRPDELSSLGLTVTDVADQLRASDARVSAGQLRGPGGNLLLEIDEELDTATRIGRTPIRSGVDGQFVQLAEIATVSKGIAEPPGTLAVVSGKRAVAVGVFVRSTKRLDVWSGAADQELERFEKALPRGVGMTTVFQQNSYVTGRLNSLLLNLFAGGVAVVAVIWLLMGWRNALVVGMALPLSALMVLTGLRGLEIPIHQMSVTGLIIALGLLIDNAIVIVDEVSEKMRDGHSAGEAVSSAVRHLALPLFGSTLTTALAFGPIALMPGPAGEFVGSIAISVILAIVSSFILAMTVTPAMAALLHSRSNSTDRDQEVKRSKGGASKPSNRWWRNGFSNARLSESYRTTLGYVFRRPVIGILLGLALPLFGFIQMANLPEQFFPPSDRDQFQIELELPPQGSLDDTLRLVEQVRERALLDASVSEVHWFLGESAPSFYYNLVPRRKNTPRYAQALVQLRPGELPQPVIHRLQGVFDREFAGARVLARQLEQGPPFDAPIELRLYGPDLERLRELGDEVRSLLAATPNVIHTRAELSEVLPKLSIRVDEEQARLAGLDHASIAVQLNAMLEGATGGLVLESTEELPVRVRLSNVERGRLDQVASLSLLPRGSANRSVDGGTYPGVPLSTVADIQLDAEVGTIPRFNGRRTNEVQAFLKAGVLPSDALAAYEERRQAAGFELPAGYTFELGGEASKRDDAVGNLMANVGVLLVLMVATLVLSFRSFRMAAIIGSVAFLSVGLGFAALWLFGYPFGFMAIVGTMGLVGVAINDAIVVLAALRENPDARVGDPDAVRDVVVRSTRHVVATSLTTMAGFAPLVLGGGGFWPPLAVAIAGGVGGATILALYYAPSVYILLMCRGCTSKVATKEAVAADRELMSQGRAEAAPVAVGSSMAEPAFEIRTGNE